MKAEQLSRIMFEASQNSAYDKVVMETPELPRQDSEVFETLPSDSKTKLDGYESRNLSKIEVSSSIEEIGPPKQQFSGYSPSAMQNDKKLFKGVDKMLVSHFKKDVGGDTDSRIIEPVSDSSFSDFRSQSAQQ